MASLLVGVTVTLLAGRLVSQRLKAFLAGGFGHFELLVAVVVAEPQVVAKVRDGDADVIDGAGMTGVVGNAVGERKGVGITVFVNERRDGDHLRGIPGAAGARREIEGGA